MAKDVNGPNEVELLVFDLAQMEWEMFQLVRNTGGRANCQDNPDTFFKMRMSQWMVYSKETLLSYHKDLEEAFANGRNLLWEKYGRMMETTFPEEYKEVEKYLPIISEEEQKLIEEMADLHLEWDAEVSKEFPNIRQRGRAFTKEEDGVMAGSSSESYFRGELMSYSRETRELVYRDMMEAKKTGRNLCREIIANETAFWGYASLEEAEEKHGNLWT